MTTQLTGARPAAAPAATGRAAATQTSVGADTAAEIVSYDPATGAEVGRVPLRSADEVRAAVARAREAQKGWGGRSYRERAAVFTRARQIVLSELEEIARLVARESGKPAAEAVAMEMVPSLDLMRRFARETEKRLRPQRIPIVQYELMGRSSGRVFRPVVVVAVIAP